MPESLDSVLTLLTILLAGGSILGLLWFSRSARMREIMSLANVPTITAAEQDVLAKEQAAERAEFELAIAEDLFEGPDTLNALSAVAQSARAEATIARTNFERNNASAPETVQKPRLAPARSRWSWILRPGMTTVVRDRTDRNKR